MSAVTKTSNPSFDAIAAQKAVMIGGLLSGDSFDYLDPVYIDTAGAVKAAISDSVSDNFDGFAGTASDSVAGTPCTILGRGNIITYMEDSDAYTPGTLLYPVGGALDDSPAFAGQRPCAKMISTTQILVMRE